MRSMYSKGIQKRNIKVFKLIDIIQLILRDVMERSDDAGATVVKEAVTHYIIITMIHDSITRKRNAATDSI